MRLAINQPYMIPYAGYFRLMAAADLFISYDDVQFPYPGWVHRNRLTHQPGSKDWLTIPIKTKPLGMKINEMEFSLGASPFWKSRLRLFPVFRNGEHPLTKAVIYMLRDHKCPLSFIKHTMNMVLDELVIKTPMQSSCDVAIDPSLKGQDRVLALCEHFGATEYINATGGQKLYDRESFRKRGIELKFLTPFENKDSILERLDFEKPKDIKREIMSNVRFVD